MRKWLGDERLCCKAVLGGGKAAGEAVELWATKAQSRWPVLIISYEQLLRHSAAAAAGGAGLLICDEARRCSLVTNFRAVQPS